MVAPYVMERPEEAYHVAPVPWKARRLLLFAGHMPRPYLSRTRGLIEKQLENCTDSGDVTMALRGTGRLNLSSYLNATRWHKFCLVSQGDTFSTKKLAEVVVLGAMGGCLPLLTREVVRPYRDVLDYQRFTISFGAPFRNIATAQEQLQRLRNFTSTEHRAIRQNLSRVASKFAVPSASKYLLETLCEKVRSHNESRIG